MKISLERAALLKTLGHVQSVVERRNTIPILSNILIRASESSVTVTATDMDVEMNETMAATVTKPGEVTISAHMLYDIVRKLPDGANISIEQADNSTQVTVKASKSNFKLGTLPVEDFPQMREDSLAVRFAIPAEKLRSMIDRTKFAISTEETRYYLNGIYLHTTTSNGTQVLRAVATDGHRLARAEMPAPKGSNEMPAVIVPRKTVQELRKLLDETSDSIVIELSQTKIRVTSGTVTLTSKLIDGTYPDYERVIPTGNDKVATLKTKDFAAAVDRVQTVNSEKSKAVKLAFGKGSLVLTSQSPEAGSATDEMEMDYNDTKVEIGFNAKYLLDVAQQIGGDTTRVVLADAGAPALIEDTADSSALYVLMPMRV